MTTGRRALLGCGLALALLAGCGDPDTPDDRGYTKAPLEDPGYTVEGEKPSKMAELGDPDQPRPKELDLPKDTMPEKR